MTGFVLWDSMRVNCSLLEECQGKSFTPQIHYMNHNQCAQALVTLIVSLLSWFNKKKLGHLRCGDTYGVATLTVCRAPKKPVPSNSFNAITQYVNCSKLGAPIFYFHTGNQKRLYLWNCISTLRETNCLELVSSVSTLPTYDISYRLHLTFKNRASHI
jgi:hypothetical protein